MRCPGCDGETEVGRFCTHCGETLMQKNPAERTEDPGTLVTRWNGLRVELNEAAGRFREVAASMDEIAASLERDHEIQLPSQVTEIPPLTTAVKEVPKAPSAAPLSSKDVPPLRPEGEQPPPESSPAKARNVVEEKTRTGPMGSVESSASASETPVGPSEEAVRAAREGATVTQRPLGTLEDDHVGKTDPRVDEARESSGTRQDERPLDDSRVFQDDVARTLSKVIQGNT